MDDVARFYTGPGGLVAAIEAALDAAGVDRSRLGAADLGAVDEFHIRGRAATLEIAEALRVGTDAHVVDLGSGLGGPARTLADVTGCRVTGIDLTAEFCAVATRLSDWTGMAAHTTFAVGDATSTGLPDSCAEGIITVHVAMNIADKPALYAEALRLLKPGGRFVAYDVLQGDGGEVHYPVPWAADASTSFLASPGEMRTMLSDAGFDVVAEVDSSDESLAWFRAVRERVEREGPPPVTFAAFLGTSFAQMVANQVANLAERRIRTVMFTCERPR